MISACFPSAYFFRCLMILLTLGLTWWPKMDCVFLLDWFQMAPILNKTATSGTVTSRRPCMRPGPHRPWAQGVESRRCYVSFFLCMFVWCYSLLCCYSLPFIGCISNQLGFRRCFRVIVRRCPVKIVIFS